MVIKKNLQYINIICFRFANGDSSILSMHWFIAPHSNFEAIHRWIFSFLFLLLLLFYLVGCIVSKCYSHLILWFLCYPLYIYCCIQHIISIQIYLFIFFFVHANYVKRTVKSDYKWFSKIDQSSFVKKPRMSLLFFYCYYYFVSLDGGNIFIKLYPMNV